MALTKIKSEGIKDGEVKNADMADDAVGVAELSATGTASSSTFLRGDNSWATPTDTNTVTSINNNADNRIITGSDTANNLEAEPNLTFNNSTLKLTVGNPAIIQSSSSGGSLAIGGGNTNPGGQILFKGGNTDANIVFKAEGSTATPAERMRIDSSGHLLVAHSSARDNFFSAVSTEHTPVIQLEGTNQNRAISLTAANQDGGMLILARQNGSVGANTVVSSGDQIGRIEFQGSGGTNMEQAAQITAEVDGTPGDNDMPGRLLFKTTADGANSPTERMRINSAGHVTKPYTPCMVFIDATPRNMSNSDNDDPLHFDREHINNGGMASTNTKSRITVPTTGIYLVSAMITGSVSTVDSGDGVAIQIKRNGSYYPHADAFPVSTLGTEVGQEYCLSFTLPISLTANDYLELCFANIGNSAEFDIDRGLFAVALLY